MRSASRTSRPPGSCAARPDSPRTKYIEARFFDPASVSINVPDAKTKLASEPTTETVHEVPLLYEAGLADRYDAVVLITAPDEVRLTHPARWGERRMAIAPASPAFPGSVVSLIWA